jgi:hypothetical protein
VEVNEITCEQKRGEERKAKGGRQLKKEDYAPKNEADKIRNEDERVRPSTRSSDGQILEDSKSNNIIMQR